MKRISIPKSMIAAALAAIVAIGLLGGAIVSAQDGGETDPTPTDRSDLRADGDHDHRHPHARLFRALVAESGLSRAVIHEGFANGNTLAETFEANGIDPGEVKAAVLANIAAKLREKVEAGVLTEEEAAAILARAGEMIDTILNAEPGDHAWPWHRRAHVFQIIARTIGIEVGQLQSELCRGGTIAEIAEAHGSSGEAVVEALMAPFIGRVRARIESGDLTEAEGARLIAEKQEKVERFVTGWTKECDRVTDAAP